MSDLNKTMLVLDHLEVIYIRLDQFGTASRANDDMARLVWK